MSDTEFRQKLAKMRALMMINDAKLMADPKPYLEDMGRRCNELLEVLDRVERALSPDFIFDVWSEGCDKSVIHRPSDIQGEALLRCNAALDELRRYRSR